ncbi:MAG: hypothetical protein HY644_03570 [Acidobacteria bacterium]|nr:hypothetical protein [Acidobacteriota bacterium]
MPNTLAELERQRCKLFKEIAHVGDMRRGSITATSGRCGKANCHCHDPAHPGQGLTYRLTYKIEGKTVSEYFATATAL